MESITLGYAKGKILHGFRMSGAVFGRLALWYTSGQAVRATDLGTKTRTNTIHHPAITERWIIADF